MQKLMTNVNQDNSININQSKLSSEEIVELQKLGPLAQEELRLKIEKKLLDVTIVEEEDQK